LGDSAKPRFDFGEPAAASPAPAGGASPAAPTAPLPVRDDAYAVRLTEPMSLEQLAKLVVGGTELGEQLRAANSGVEGTDRMLPAGTQVWVPRQLKYTVRRGDSLAGIAGRVLGDRERYTELAEANKDVLPDPGAMEVGMVLTIPVDKVRLDKLFADGPSL
jgi:nucleoid-associated protein YgaU